MDELHQLLPMAVAMMISPLPIVATVAILLSARGRSAAPAYAGAFTAASAAIVAVGALTAAGASSSASGGGKSVVLVLTVVLTVGFAALAVASWASRPKPGVAATAPSWLAAVDTITARRAAGLGLLMAVTNTKNLPLQLKGGALIGAAHLSPPAVALWCVGFAVAGSLALIVPTVLAATGSPTVARALSRLKGEMIAHNAVIMTVLFAVLASVEASHLIHQLTA